MPGKVVKIDKEEGFAIIDYSGEKRTASTELVDVKPGDYVIVQAQFIIQKIPEKEAIEGIKVWEQHQKK